MLNVFRKHKKDPKSELRSLLGDYELPSFSGTVMNVLATLRNPDFSMTEVAEQLQADPGLHVKILKTVNSAAFGLSTRVSNLHHAVTLLGRSRLETIVLSQAVNGVLPTVEFPFFDMRQFWVSAARRASLARALAHHLHPTTQVESFTAGLLQDMALPVLITIKPKEYRIIMRRWKTEKESWLDTLEREALGYDHPMIGALMAEVWGLPEYLIIALSGHHDWDEKSQVEPAIKLVSYIRGGDKEDDTDIIINLCIEKFGMEQNMATEMINKAIEDAKELAKMLR